MEIAKIPRPRIKLHSWLKVFAGQEVTVEIAPCNWNSKTDNYAGCVLAVRNADGSKTLNELNFTK